MNARETYQLLIRIQRVFDAVSCPWTGEAKGHLADHSKRRSTEPTTGLNHGIGSASCSARIPALSSSA